MGRHPALTAKEGNKQAMRRTTLLCVFSWVSFGMYARNSLAIGPCPPWAFRPPKRALPGAAPPGNARSVQVRGFGGLGVGYVGGGMVI